MSSTSPDLRFLLDDWLNLGGLLAQPRYAHLDRDALIALDGAAADLARNVLAPHAARADAIEPRMVDGRVELIAEIGQALDACREAGFFALDVPLAEGGLGLPYTVVSAMASRLCEANAPTWAYAFLTMAAANLIRAYGDEAQKARWLPPMVDGRWFGTMCLSEPHAGSSVGDIRTLAEPQADGSYHLRGTKMWVSGGEHDLSQNIVHLVLAKIPGGPLGTKGISLFIVPRLRGAEASAAALAALADSTPETWVRNGITLAGVNHKLGYRANVNCLLNLGEDAPCVGELIGAPHQGMAQMFQMMNAARIGVGAGAASMGLAGYRAALAYARERTQGRLPSERDPARPMRPIIDHADVRRMLLKAKAFSEGALALILYASRLADEALGDDPIAGEQARILLDFLTPIVKTWPSTYALEANDLAIQILGGAGYVRDHPVERLWRDNRLNAIHEGTTGIQGLDLLGRKILGDGGRALGQLFERAQKTLDAADAVPQLQAESVALRAWIGQFASAIQAVGAKAMAGEVDLALANAHWLLDALGHWVIGWLWLDQGLAAQARIAAANAAERKVYAGKLAAMRYFIAIELPTKAPLLDAFARLDRSVCDTDGDIL